MDAYRDPDNASHGNQYAVHPADAHAAGAANRDANTRRPTPSCHACASYDADRGGPAYYYADTSGNDHTHDWHGGW